MRLGRWLVVVVVVTVGSGTSGLVEIGDGNIKGIKGIINTMGLEIKSYVIGAVVICRCRRRRRQTRVNQNRGRLNTCH